MLLGMSINCLGRQEWMPLGYPAIGFGGRTSCSWVLLARGESKGLFYKKAKFKI